MLREHGISLCLDLVLNHVAREHAWAERARAGDPTTAPTSTCTPTASMPDEYERTLPEVFPDFAPGNFTWDDELDGWVWTTFNDYQWDVNWSNPDVLCEYADIILNLANHGVEVLRLDAIAFIWKRMGTDLPEPARGARAHPGAPHGRPDRCSGRRCSRPRRSSGRRTCWPTSGRASTTARSAISPTTTA